MRNIWAISCKARNPRQMTVVPGEVVVAIQIAAQGGDP
jgi:hypothetical protein